MPGISMGGGLSDEFMAHALREFALEAQSLGDEVEAAVLALEQSQGDMAHVNTIFRCFHTMKGSAGLFGFDALEHFCHSLETVLEPLRAGIQTLDSAKSTLLLRCNDHIRTLLDRHCSGGSPGREVLLHGNTLLEQMEVRSQPESQAVTGRTKPVAPVQTVAEHVEPLTGGHVAPLRVDPGKLDDIIALLGELAIAQSSANLLAQRHQDSVLTQSHERMQELTHAIRHRSMALRMVPIGETLNRFRRVVRDLGTSLGKELVLDIVGGDIELDKSLVDKIADPLMHLVRNALDHGLETPAERLAAGKKQVGHLLLEARHDAGHVTITLQDDGRGIDRSRVLARAQMRGLVTSDRALADQEILNLIFAPGFSTADTVSNVSGRGVGMDVVKSSIEALRGTVRIESEAGQGMRVVMSLPLTLASFDGFMVQVAQTYCIVPLAQVQEVVDWAPALSQQGHMDLRGAVVPVLQLRKLYGLEGDAAARVSVLVLRHHDHLFGIEVDTLVGPHQTVLKSLGPLFRTVPGVAGSSLLGDGTVALVLDLESLFRLARLQQ